MILVPIPSPYLIIVNSKLRMHLTAICDAEFHIDRGHFCVLYMKYSQKREVKSIIDFLEFRIHKILNFDKTVEFEDDPDNPFYELFNKISPHLLINEPVLRDIVSEIESTLHKEIEKVNNKQY